MTFQGGVNNAGVIFLIDTDGTGFKKLYDFTNSANGNYPYGSSTISGGKLYGMASSMAPVTQGGVVFSFQDSLTGINELVTNKSISVYPNPSNGKFNVQLSETSSQLSVEVYNVLGEKVLSQLSTVNYPLSIDLVGNPPGVYFYRITDKQGSQIATGKLMIQK